MTDTQLKKNWEEKTYLFGKDTKIRITLEGNALKHILHETLLTTILGAMPGSYPVSNENIPAYYLRCLTCEGPHRENGYKTIAYFNLDGSQRPNSE